VRALLRWLVVPLAAAAVVMADQWTKSWIENNVPLNSGFPPFPSLEAYFNIVHFQNTGAAFGILRGQGSLFVGIGVVVMIALLVFARQLAGGAWAVRLCLALQLGGAAGNLVDRLQHGHVTDFMLFTLPVGARVYQWPAWNVADASIVVGTILLGVLLLLQDRQATLEARAADTSHGAALGKSEEA
jgi:signal peptidase II